MKHLIYASILLILSSCTSASSPRSVVYESTSFDACTDVGGFLSGSKFGNVYKNVFGGSSVGVCKKIDVVEEPRVFNKVKKERNL